MPRPAFARQRISKRLRLQKQLRADLGNGTNNLGALYPAEARQLKDHVRRKSGGRITYVVCALPGGTVSEREPPLNSLEGRPRVVVEHERDFGGGALLNRVDELFITRLRSVHAYSTS